MKILYLIGSKVWMIIRQNTLVFIVLCVGLISCDLMFVYSFGLWRQFVQNSGVVDYYLYAVEGEQSVDELSELIESVKPSCDNDYYCKIESGTIIHVDESINWNEYMIRTSNCWGKFYAASGSVDDLTEVGTVLVPEKFYNAELIGNAITLNNVPLKVVGSAGQMNVFYVSMETMEVSNFLINIAALRLNDNGKLRKVLQDVFDGEYNVEYNKNEAIRENARSELYQVYAIYIICSLTFLYFCTYFYTDSAYEFNIYAMIGAKKWQVIIIFSGALFCILSVIYMMAVIIHGVLYDVIFQPLFTEGGYFYTLWDYTIVFGLSVVAVMVLILLWLSIKLRGSMITTARKVIY